MKVIIDRGQRIVWITDVPARWACWAGYYFAANEPELVGAHPWWHIYTYEEGDKQPVPKGSHLEQYNVLADNSCAGKIASLVKNPPLPIPIHDCPSCRCEPGCCQ